MSNSFRCFVLLLCLMWLSRHCKILFEKKMSVHPSVFCHCPKLSKITLLTLSQELTTLFLYNSHTLLQRPFIWKIHLTRYASIESAVVSFIPPIPLNSFVELFALAPKASAGISSGPTAFPSFRSLIVFLNYSLDFTNESHS